MNRSLPPSPRANAIDMSLFTVAPRMEIAATLVSFQMGYDLRVRHDVSIDVYDVIQHDFIIETLRAQQASNYAGDMRIQHNVRSGDFIVLAHSAPGMVAYRRNGNFNNSRTPGVAWRFIKLSFKH